MMRQTGQGSAAPNPLNRKPLEPGLLGMKELFAKHASRTDFVISKSSAKSGKSHDFDTDVAVQAPLAKVDVRGRPI